MNYDFKKKLRFLIILFPILSIVQQNVIGQALELSKNIVDMGKIAAVANSPKVVHFKNTSSEKLAILLVEKGPDVSVHFEHRFFSPGEEGTISIYYNPRTTGQINEEISFFDNLDDKPQVIKLTGNVVSITECFPDPQNLLKRNIEVIDSITKEPVPRAQLELTHNHNKNNLVRIKVNDEGKATEELPIGLYNVLVTADNYNPLTDEFFLPKSQPNILLELSPLKKKEIPSAPEPVPLTNTVIPDQPVTYSELPENQYAANNIILLLDVSSSMKSNKKFILLQQAVNNLVMILRPFDYVSLITYSSEAKTILRSVPGNNKEQIIDAVETLVPYGITRGVKGLNAAYELATAHYIDGGNNLIVLATDGEFSETTIPDSYYEELIGSYAKEHICLSVFGFGVNEDAIKRMQKMTRAGEGSFILIRTEEQTKDFLIEEIKLRSYIPK